MIFKRVQTFHEHLGDCMNGIRSLFQEKRQNQWANRTHRIRLKAPELHRVLKHVFYDVI